MVLASILRGRGIAIRLWPTQQRAGVQVGPDGSVRRWRWKPGALGVPDDPGEPPAAAGVREPRRPPPSSNHAAAEAER